VGTGVLVAGVATTAAAAAADDDDGAYDGACDGAVIDSAVAPLDREGIVTEMEPWRFARTLAVLAAAAPPLAGAYSNDARGADVPPPAEYCDTYGVCAVVASAASSSQNAPIPIAAVLLRPGVWVRAPPDSAMAGSGVCAALTPSPTPCRIPASARCAISTSSACGVAETRGLLTRGSSKLKRRSSFDSAIEGSDLAASADAEKGELSGASPRPIEIEPCRFTRTPGSVIP
jgi:hypothetical protein